MMNKYTLGQVAGGVLPARGPASPVLPTTRHRRRKGEPMGFTGTYYRDLITAPAADCDARVIQYRPYLIVGCLATTGLTLEPW